MIATKDLVENIRTLLAKEYEVDISEITPDAPLLDTLDLDSLDMVDVVVLVEENWGITLKAEDFIGVETFQDFYNLIASRTQNNA